MSQLVLSDPLTSPANSRHLSLSTLVSRCCCYSASLTSCCSWPKASSIFSDSEFWLYSQRASERNRYIVSRNSTGVNPLPLDSDSSLGSYKASFFTIHSHNTMQTRYMLHITYHIHPKMLCCFLISISAQSRIDRSVPRVRHICIACKHSMKFKGKTNIHI